MTTIEAGRCTCSELWRAEKAQLIRERDEALAVANDRREDLGLTRELVTFLVSRACACGAHHAASLAADAVHDQPCQAAAWARRVGGLDELNRQLDAAWAMALRENQRKHHRARC